MSLLVFGVKISLTAIQCTSVRAQVIRNNWMRTLSKRLSNGNHWYTDTNTVQINLPGLMQWGVIFRHTELVLYGWVRPTCHMSIEAPPNLPRNLPDPSPWPQLSVSIYNASSTGAECRLEKGPQPVSTMMTFLWPKKPYFCRCGSVEASALRWKWHFSALLNR